MNNVGAREGSALARLGARANSRLGSGAGAKLGTPFANGGADRLIVESDGMVNMIGRSNGPAAINGTIKASSHELLTA